MGIFFALYSGTYDSIVYDTLLEETGSGDGFERYNGRIVIADSIALVTSSIAGGLLGAFINLRADFFLSVPFALISIIALAMFREPKLHKSRVSRPMLTQVRLTLSAVTRNP